MSYAQIAIIAVLLATVGMFLWGRWRHDMVASVIVMLLVYLELRKRTLKP